MKPYYEADGVVLYHGNNAEVLAALGLRPDDVDFLWGDPPYGIERAFDGGRHRLRASNFASPALMHGDEEPFLPAPWLVYRKAILWGANHYASRLPDVKGWVCWDKATRNDLDLRQAEFELAWTNFLARPKGFRHLWSGGYRATEQGVHLHPTQKPVVLASWVFRLANLEPGSLVLSPWLGSGGEAVAARNRGLRFIGVELVEEYLEACATRLRQRPLPLEAPAERAPAQADLLPEET